MRRNIGFLVAFAGKKPSQALPRQLSRRESQAVKFVAEVLSVMRKFPAVLLALPLGELSPQVTERACKANACCPSSGATRHFPPVGEGFSGSDTVSGTAKDVPLGELARERLRGFSLILLHYIGSVKPRQV